MTKRELECIEGAVSRVYCELTNGRISNWNTHSDAVIAVANDVAEQNTQEACHESYAEGLAAGKIAGLRSAARQARRSAAASRETANWLRSPSYIGGSAWAESHDMCARRELMLARLLDRRAAKLEKKK